MRDPHGHQVVVSTNVVVQHQPDIVPALIGIAPDSSVTFTTRERTSDSDIVRFSREPHTSFETVKAGDWGNWSEEPETIPPSNCDAMR